MIEDREQQKKIISSIHDECHGERFNPHLVVNVPNIKQQHGTKDCGVFAIAYEYHAALGDDVSIMADLHNDVTYEGWGKTSAAGHRECMGNSKRVLRRSFSLLR